MFFRKLFTAFFVLAASLPAFAQKPSDVLSVSPPTPPRPIMPGDAPLAFTARELVDRMRFCVTSAQSKDRLRCYDALASGLGITIEAEHVPEGASNGGLYAWTLSSVEGSDGFAEPSITLSATDVVADHTLLGHPIAALVLRCQSHETHLFVSFGKPVAARKSEVKISIDGQVALPAVWESSTTGASVGLWTSDKSIPIAKDLLEATRLSVHANVREGEIVAVFDISGIKQAVDPVRKSCKW